MRAPAWPTVRGRGLDGQRPAEAARGRPARSLVRRGSRIVEPSARGVEGKAHQAEAQQAHGAAAASDGAGAPRRPCAGTGWPLAAAGHPGGTRSAWRRELWVAGRCARRFRKVVAPGAMPAAQRSAAPPAVGPSQTRAARRADATRVARGAEAASLDLGQRIPPAGRRRAENAARTLAPPGLEGESGGAGRPWRA